MLDLNEQITMKAEMLQHEMDAIIYEEQNLKKECKEKSAKMEIEI